MGMMRAMRLLGGLPDPQELEDPGTLTAAAQQLPLPQLASPFVVQPSSLTSIVWADLLDAAGAPATRAEAMSVPAIAKARHVVAPQVADTPLVAIDSDDQLLPEQPTWIYRTDDGVSPFHRMLWTVDDLIFNGWALWQVERGAAGQLLTASYVSSTRWGFDRDSRILLDGEHVSSSRIVLIPGPHEGILTFGRTTIRHARQLLSAAATAGQTPNAQTELRQTQPPPADWSQADVDLLLDGWADARRGDRGGVAFTSYGVEAIDHGSIDGQLLVEGRNASAVDCARIVGVTAAMVDATAPKASLNYETTQGRGLEHTRYGVEPYMAAIQARLSLDDVVPRGQRVRFDLADDIDTDTTPGPNPLGPHQED